MSEDLIFFGAECPFCHQSVRSLLEFDEEKKFLFAPLGGETAQEIFSGPQKGLLRSNGLVLVEKARSTEREFWTKSHALLRAYWLIGRGWGLVGVFSFAPRVVGDFFYDRFAQHRHQLTLKMAQIPDPEGRFLP